MINKFKKKKTLLSHWFDQSRKCSSVLTKFMHGSTINASVWQWPHLGQQTWLAD